MRANSDSYTLTQAFSDFSNLLSTNEEFKSAYYGEFWINLLFTLLGTGFAYIPLYIKNKKASKLINQNDAPSEQSAETQPTFVNANATLATQSTPTNEGFSDQNQYDVTSEMTEESQPNTIAEESQPNAIMEESSPNNEQLDNAQPQNQDDDDDPDDYVNSIIAHIKQNNIMKNKDDKQE